ncbi:MAG: hypothetical protein RLZZ214_1335 [Verrucomicrobiota bacterium]
MARKTEFNHVKTKAGWMVSIPPGLSSTGKRERCYFKTRDAARDFATGLKEKTKSNGESASAIPPAMAEDAVLATAVLAPWGLSLLEAARLAASLKERESASCTVKDALAAWTLSCEGLKAPTLATYKNTTKRLEAALGSRILSTLDVDDLQKGLGLVGTSGAAAANHYRAGRAFWRWAGKKGWCKIELYERVDAPRSGKSSNVEFLSIEQCQALLRTAEEHFPKSVASYAILLFTGLRPSEFARLRTEDVSAEGIEVNAESKIAKRRHITPIKTLKIWLEKYPFERVSNWRRTDQAVRYLAGWDVWTDPDFFTPPPQVEGEMPAPRLPWPQDATRHTFATYSINNGVMECPHSLIQPL